MITLFLPCFVSRMGSELSHRALHSCTSHSRLQLRAPRVWSGHGTGLAPVCTPGHCVQLSTAQSGAAAGSRRKVREIENSDERATRAFRLRKQVGAVRWKRERRSGAAYAQGRRSTQVSGNMMMIFLIPNMNTHTLPSLWPREFSNTQDFVIKIFWWFIFFFWVKIIRSLTMKFIKRICAQGHQKSN